MSPLPITDMIARHAAHVRPTPPVPLSPFPSSAHTLVAQAGPSLRRLMAVSKTGIGHPSVLLRCARRLLGPTMRLRGRWPTTTTVGRPLPRQTPPTHEQTSIPVPGWDKERCPGVTRPPTSGPSWENPERLIGARLARAFPRRSEVGETRLDAFPTRLDASSLIKTWSPGAGIGQSQLEAGRGGALWGRR